MRRALCADYEQVHLLPPCLEDWIGPEHPARFIREFVDALELAELGFARHESAEGGEYFPSQVLLKVWLYGYFKKMRSTRLLENGCRNEVGLIWLCGTRAPDHNTLWRFFVQHKEPLREVFGQSVQIALKLDLVGLVLQAIDGTKIEARCRGQGAFDQRANRQLLAALEQAIAEQEQAIEEAAREQRPLGPELPKELCGKKKLRQEVVKALFEIEEQGRKHCQPKEPEARRMPGERGNRFSYNAQVAVDAKAQIIVAAQVVTQENDQGLLVPLAQAARENTGGAIPVSVADGGYASSEQFAAAEAQGLEIITPLPNAWRNKQGDPFHASHFVHEPKRDVVRCPQGRELPFLRVRDRRGTPVRVYRSAAVCKSCPLRAQCTSDRHGRTIEIGPHHEALLRHRAKMLEKTAAQRLGQRAGIVEPVFAQIKQNGNFRRWSVGGLDAVGTQWALLCTSWNLRVLYRRWRCHLAPAV